MKRFTSILFLLSVIAFAGVSAPAYENTGQRIDFATFVADHQSTTATGWNLMENSALTFTEDVGTVGLPCFAIIESPSNTIMPNVLNPDTGLRDYNWQHDKRNDIRQSCRRNC